jgi:hypothetical protein
MRAAEDCQAYWLRTRPDVLAAERARVAFEERWFGTKSEARVRTIMTDMLERFDAYPEALALLRRLGMVPALVRPWICHVHTQLADPVYRRFSGEFLPARRDQGYTQVDRESVARWVQETWPERWSSTTCLKFGSNLLSTAYDAGLLTDRRDPRKLAPPSPPREIVSYAFYLLRGLDFEGTITDNRTMRSMGVSLDSLRLLGGSLPALRVVELGGAFEITWEAPDLMTFGLEAFGGGA